MPLDYRPEPSTLWSIVSLFFYRDSADLRRNAALSYISPSLQDADDVFAADALRQQREISERMQERDNYRFLYRTNQLPWYIRRFVGNELPGLCWWDIAGPRRMVAERAMRTVSQPSTGTGPQPSNRTGSQPSTSRTMPDAE